MASVVVEKAEGERVLSFGTGGRLGFEFWRRQLHPLYFCGALAMGQVMQAIAMKRGPTPHIPFIPWIFVALGLSSIPYAWWKARRLGGDYREFVRVIGDHSPIVRVRTGRGRWSLLSRLVGELLLFGLIFGVTWLVARGIEKMPVAERMNGWILLGAISLMVTLLLSLINFGVIAARMWRNEAEELLVYDGGILWSRHYPVWGDPTGNAFAPWGAIERVEWREIEMSRPEMLTIRTIGDRDFWITFRKFSDEQRDELLGAIGERVGVVRSG